MPNFLEALGIIVIGVVLAILTSRAGMRRWEGGSYLIILYGIFAVIANIWYGATTLFVAPAPIITATSNPVPTKTPLPMKAIPPTREPCFRWDQIKASMDGDEVCVYGTVHSVYYTAETWTRIRFTSEANNFFLFSSLYTFDDLSSGSCVQANGTVELYERIPFVNVGDTLYYCDPWME